MVWRGGSPLQVDQRVKRAVAQTAWLRGRWRRAKPAGVPGGPGSGPLRPRLGDASRGIDRGLGFLPPWLGSLGKGWPRRRLTQQAGQYGPGSRRAAVAVIAPPLPLGQMGQVGTYRPLRARARARKPPCRWIRADLSHLSQAEAKPASAAVICGRSGPCVPTARPGL